MNNVAIDISTYNTQIIFHKMISSNIEGINLIPFNGQDTSLIKIVEEKRPISIILNYNSDYSAVPLIKQTFPETKVIHVGNDSELVLADLVTGVSNRINSLGIEGVIDVEMLSSVKKESKNKTGIICLTNSFKRVNASSAQIESLTDLANNHGVKLFGNERVDTPNYLGKINLSEMGEIVGSAHICIDMTGLDYHNYIVLGAKNVLVHNIHFNTVFSARMALKGEIFSSKEYKDWLSSTANNIKNSSYKSLIQKIKSYIQG